MPLIFFNFSFIFVYLQFVDAELSKKILEQARLQQNELEEEEGISPKLKCKTVSLNENSASDNSEPESDNEFEGDYMGEIVSLHEDLNGFIPSFHDFLLFF